MPHRNNSTNPSKTLPLIWTRGCGSEAPAGAAHNPDSLHTDCHCTSQDCRMFTVNCSTDHSATPPTPDNTRHADCDSTDMPQDTTAHKHKSLRRRFGKGTALAPAVEDHTSCVCWCRTAAEFWAERASSSPQPQLPGLPQHKDFADFAQPSRENTVGYCLNYAEV